LSLNTIAKNIQLIVTSLGQGDFKTLWTKEKDTCTIQG
jgi:hypothetical protein